MLGYVAGSPAHNVKAIVLAKRRNMPAHIFSHYPRGFICFLHCAWVIKEISINLPQLLDMLMIVFIFGPNDIL